MKRILIIGATSAIAEATARRFAAQGHRLYLWARNTERLDAIAADMRVSGATEVQIAPFDARKIETLPDQVTSAWEAVNGFDIVLIAHGTLPDQKACEQNVALTMTEIGTNALSVIALLTVLANHMETIGQGTLAVITSVAGDRGRQSNYVYGAAKGAVGIFLQGLRNRLANSGVHVLTIKPGFVDTPMTADFGKGALWVTPEAIATGIVHAINKKKLVVYLPAFWQLIMLIIRQIPERLFMNLKL